MKLNERADALAKLARDAGRDISPDACRWKYAPTELKADENNREIVAIANTARVDHDNEVVIPEGAITEPFELLKSIYWNHQYWEPPIGAMRRMKLLDGVWRVRMTISKTQLGEDIYRLVQDEAINGTSIGFEADDFGSPTDDEISQYGNVKTVHRTWKWFELSITPMPCNHDAIIETRSSDEWFDRLERAVKTRRIAQKSAHLMGLPERSKTVVVATRRKVCVV